MSARTTAAACAALLLSCSGSDEHAPAQQAAPTVGAYIGSLPAWPAPSPDQEVPQGAPSTRYLTGTDGVNYRCETQEYSLTRTPEQMVTLDPNAQILWPGGLLQGGKLAAGELAGLPIAGRAPLAVSIPTLLAAHNTIDVETPNLATVQQAVGTLVSEAIAAGVRPSSSVSYQQTTADTASQTALSLGLSASYMGFDLDAALGLSRSANLHTVVGSFVQSMFTVAVPEPQRPGDFFDGVTQAEVDDLVARGMLGPDNLPVYVAAVTYGRMMMFSVTSSAATAEIEAALNAQYSGFGASAGLSARYAALLSNASTQFRVVTVGGDPANAEAMIATGDPSQFFSSDPLISTGVPISYTLRYLRDNTIAAVSETASYQVKTCSQTAIGAGGAFYALRYGAFSRDLLAFDRDGRPLALARPIHFDGATFPNGPAYDSRADLLYVPDTSVPTIHVFAPDGTPMETPFAGVNANAVAYDAKYDRLLARNSGAGTVDAYTTTGLKQASYPLLSRFFFDPSRDWLLGAVPEGIQAFTLGGARVEFPPGSFPALGDPFDLAPDLSRDRVYVTTRSPPYRLSAYTLLGVPIFSVALPDVADIVVDPVRDRVIAFTAYGIALAFGPDGAPLPLPDGAFAGLTSIAEAVFRP